MRKFEKVKRIEEDIQLPKRATKSSAGYDFYAIENMEIEPIRHVVFDNILNNNHIVRHKNVQPTLVRTGVKADMMDNEFLLLCNRSSNPSKKSLVLANGVGIIDKDYYGNPDNDGEIMFSFYNVSNEPVEIKKGDKIGQGIFMKYGITDDDNADGERFSGFGSTGE